MIGEDYETVMIEIKNNNNKFFMAEIKPDEISVRYCVSS